ncbi:MAG: G8 domain-containing protein [Candidatus Latescibacterota bacterium]
MSSANYTIQGTYTPVSAASPSSGSSTIIFTGTSQTIPAFTYNNLTLSGATTPILASSGTITITGTYTLGSVVPTVTGSTVAFTGASQTIPASTYNNLNLSGATTPAALSSATYTIAGTFTPVSAASPLSGSSTITFTGTSQTIPAFTYNNLTLSGATTPILASSGTITIAGTLTTGSVVPTVTGSTVAFTGTSQTIPAFTYNNLTLSGATTPVLASSGTITITGTLTTGSVVPAVTGSTVAFTGTSQTIPGFTYNNLTINQSSGDVTLSGTATINGTLTLTGGNVITSSYTLAISSSGSISRTSGYIVGNFQKYIATGATLATFEIGDATNYTPVDITFSSVSVAGNLTASTTAGDHPNIGSSTINSTASVNRYWTLTNSGITFTTYSARFTFVAGDIDGGANTSNFIVGNYNSGWTYPTVGTRVTTRTQAIDLTSFGDFQLGESGSSVTWDGGASTNNWGDAANWNPDGVPASTNSVNLNGINTINVNVAGVCKNLILNNASLVLTVKSGNSLTVSGNLTVMTGTLNTEASFPAVSGTTTLTAGTVGYTASSGSQTVAVQSYANLTISGGGTKTLAGTITPGGDLSIEGGIFDLGSYTANRSSAGGTMTVANGATLKIGGTGTLPSNYSTHSIGATSAVEYAGSTTTVASLNSSQNYGNLTISGTGVATTSSFAVATALTVNSGGSFIPSSGTITLNNGSSISNSGTLTFQGLSIAASAAVSGSGNFAVAGTLTVNSGGTFTPAAADIISGAGTLTGSGTVKVTRTAATADFSSQYTITTKTLANLTIEYAGSAAQVISALTYGHLKMNNSNGVTMGGNATVNGTMTLSSGNVTTGSYTLAISSSGSISRTSGHVIGNFQKYIATGATSATFEIGDATNYTPVDISFGSVSVAGNLTAKTTAGDHPIIGSSTINSTKSVNRYWTLTNSGITFTTYSATFTFVAGDIDSGANTSNFIVGNYNSGWTYATVGTKASTSTQATDLTSFGDFQLGENIVIVNGKTWDGGASTNNWNDANNWNPDGVPTSSDNVIIDSGYTVLISSASGVCASLTIGTGNGSGALSISATTAGNYTLTVSGNVSIASNGSFTITNQTTNNTHTVNISGNLEVQGTFNMVSGTDDIASVIFNGSTQQTISGAGSTCTFYNLTISNTSTTGVVLYRDILLSPATTNNLNPTLTVSSGDIFDISTYTCNSSALGVGAVNVDSGSKLRIAGTNNFPSNYTTIGLNATSTVEYYGTSQTLGAQTYGNLTLSGSGTKTSGDAISVSNNLIVGDGVTFSHGAYNLTAAGTTTIGSGSGSTATLAISSATGTKTFTGLVTVAANGIWNNSPANSPVSFAGGITNNGTFTAGTGNHTFQTNDQSLTGTFSIPSVTVTGITLTNTNTLTVDTALSGTGNLTQAASATLNLGGTSDITTLTATAAGNTVNFNGTGSQTIPPFNYYNLTSSSSGNRILGTPGTIGVSGTFTPGSNSYTITGSTFNFNASGSQSIPVFTYNDLVFSQSGTKSLSGAITINGSLSITGSSVANLGTYTSSSSTLLFGSTPQIAGSWGGTGSSATNKNSTYFGTTATGILNVATTINSYTWIGGTSTAWDVASNWSPTQVPTSSDDAVISSGTYQPTISLAAVCNNITINSGTTLTISGSNTLTVSSNWTNNGGTFSAGTGTVTFNGTSQIIGGSSSTTFYNVITSGTTNTITGIATTISGNLSVGNGTVFTAAGYNLTVAGTTTVGGGTSGILNISSATGTKLFTGLVTVAANGTWNNTAANSPVSFAGGITNNGTFNAGTGIYTFQTNNQALTGTISIPNVTVTGITLTNTNTLTVNTALSGTGNLTQAASATLNLGGTSGITTLAATADPNTVNYTGSGQTLKVTSYNNLTLSGGAETFGAITTVNGNLTLNGTASATTGAALNVGGNLTVGDGTTFTADAYTLNITGTTTIGIGGLATATLAISSATGTKTFSGAVTISTNGVITESAACALSFGSDVIINGTLTENGDATVAIAGSFTNNGTYTSSTGVHTFSGTGKTIGGSQSNVFSSVTVSGSYTNNQLLICLITLSVTGTFTNNSTINLTPVQPATLSGAGGLTNNATGVLNIGGTSTITTLTVTAAGNLVNYYGAAQTVKATTYDNLTLSGTGAKTFPAGTTTVNNILSIENAAYANTFTGTLSYGTNATLQYNTTSARAASNEWVTPFAATGGVIIKNTGTITLNAAKVFNASIPLTINSGATLATGNYQMDFGGDFVNNGGTFTSGSSTIIMTNTAATQNISGFSTTGTVSMTKTAGTATLTGAISAGQLTINGVGGTLNLGSGFSHTVTNVTLTNGTIDCGSCTLNVGGTWSGTTGFSAGTGTINYNGPTQTVAGLTYNNLIINQSSGNAALGGAATVSGTITLTSGTFSVGANTLTLNGPTIAGTPANLSTTSSSSLVFGGSSSGVNIPGSVTALNNLTINNTNGVTLNSSPTINGTFTLTSGNVTTGSYTLAIGSTGSVSRTSGYVIGNFKKNIATGATSKTFEIGDASSYSPVVVAFGNVTVTGDLTVSTTLGDHPDIANSGIDSNKGVNRFWTLTYSGITFDNYSATFTFVSGDVDASATTANFIVGNYDGAVWTNPTVGTKTSTSTQATGITVFGDFIIGEIYSGTTPATYYLTTAGVSAAQTPGNWNTGGIGGGGTAATNFINSGDVFIVSSGQSATSNGNVTFGAGVTLQLNNTGTINITGSGIQYRMNGIIIFGGTSTTQITLAGGGSGQTFILGSGATLKTVNTNGVSGSNCSLPASASLRTVTLNTGANYEFNGSSAQATLGMTSTVATLTINNTAGVTLGAATAISRTLTIGNVTSSSVFNDGGYQITSTGTLYLTSGTFKLGSGATATTYPAFATNTIGSTTTVDYASTAAQTIAAVNYGNLTNSGNGNRTLASSGTIGIAGAFTPGTGTYTVTGSTVSYNGSSQTIAALTYNNLTTIQSSGNAALGGAATVGGTLTLTSGNIITGSYTLTIGSSGSVSRTSGHIVGNFKKHVVTGSPSVTFEIGDTSNYTPVSLVFNGVGTAGDLTASTTSGDHTDIANSRVDGSKSVNRFWTLTNSGIAINYYSATFNFVSGDIDAPANTANFVVGNKNGSTWTIPTVGTKTSTSTQATGITVFGDFIVGNIKAPDVVVLKSVQTISDPVNSTTNPKAIPGAVMLYTIQVSNHGTGWVDNNTTIITDPISSNLKLFINDLGSSGSGPALFIDGTPSSGLTYTFTSLSSTSDDLDFSSDSGSTWTYVPSADSDGCDSNVTNIRVNPKGILAGAGSGNPSFEIRMNVRIK